MKKSSIAIVEDNSSIRYALAEIISASDKYELSCVCNNGEDALVKLPLYLPNLVLTDIRLGGIDGIELVRLMKKDYPDMLFMMCTVYEDDEKIYRALSAGANGYILKKTKPAKLLEAIDEIQNGGAPMSSQIARKVVATFQQKSTDVTHTDLTKLSKRELEILEMLAKGLVYKEISFQLSISSETVRKHVYNVYSKLHVGNRIEAVNKFFGKV